MNEEDSDLKALVLGEGDLPHHSIIEVFRPNLESIPDLQLPEGVATRPDVLKDLLSAWETCEVAMPDHPDYSQETYSEEHYEA